MTPARRTTIAATILCAAAIVAVAAILPPASRVLPAPPWQPAGTLINGIYHVHTVRSDGAGTPEEVAAAASRAGLQFVLNGLVR
jgi:hypothetical protein